MRAHKVLLSKLASLAWRFNSELDAGRSVTIAEARAAIDGRRVIRFIIDRFGVEPRVGEIDTLDPEDEVTISECFSNLDCATSVSEWRIANNGLCLLLAYTIDMMAKEEWTTF
jgi:hypothetical protein